MKGCLVLPLLLLLLPLAAVFAGTRRPSDLTGRFLWFTDNHVDLAGDINSPLDKRCAWMPKEQWETAVAGMLAVDNVPDFIIFSGDFVHFPARNASDLTKEVILETVLSLTNTMQSSFPGIKLFPCLGNHDYSPSNNWPSQLEHSAWLYGALADAWRPWLPAAALATLNQTGWYAADAIPGKLRVLALNTNYWAAENQFTDVPDMDGLAHQQIVWLEDELEQARKDGVKVYINGHHPAVGVFADTGIEVDGLWPLHSMRYMVLTQRYADIIEGQFYGHDHVDEVRVINECRYAQPDGAVSSVQSCDGKASGVIYIGPAMTNCNDPSFRVWEYDKESFVLQDYQQYHYQEAAVHNKDSDTAGVRDVVARDGSVGATNRSWPLHYRWADTYGHTMTDLSAASWKAELSRISVNGSVAERAAFFARRGFSKCDAHCQTFYFCNVVHTDLPAFMTCVFEATRPPAPPAVK